jgi:hypothetical protein
VTRSEKTGASGTSPITVTSPGRKYRCNVPDDSGIELEFNPTMMTPKRTGNGKEQNTEKLQESGEETNMADNQNSNKNGEGNNEINANGNGNGNGKKDKNEKSNDDNNNNNNRGPNRGGSAGRGGRGGRGGRRAERIQLPSKEWATHDFAMSFNPKAMKNKDPNAEFIAMMSQIIIKSPGVTFHPTNEDMYAQNQEFI